MKKVFLSVLLAATTVLLSTQVIANPVERVLAHGKDGDKFYYQISCTNGTRGSVVVQDKDKKICAQAFRGKRVCNAAWSVERAAKHACS